MSYNPYAYSEFVIEWNDLKTVCPEETVELEKAPLWSRIGLAGLLADPDEWVDVEDSLGDLSAKRRRSLKKKYLFLTRRLLEAFKHNTGGLVLRPQLHRPTDDDGHAIDAANLTRRLIVDGMMAYTAAGFYYRHIIERCDYVEWG